MPRMTRFERLESLLTLVRDMREAQKDYFHNRTHEALRIAKDLEERVDIQLLHFAGTFKEAPKQWQLPLIGGER